MGRKFVIEIEDTGLGDPLAADPEGKPAELFIGSLAFQVTLVGDATGDAP